ncbi:MAG: HlyD family secretion protein [Spirosomataceae bacterium]
MERQKQEKVYRELRSDAVQEILSYRPSWLIRYGTSLFSVFFLLLFAGTFFISYPDIVKGTLKLTSYDIPKAVVAKSGGKIVKLFIKENSKVEANQILAYLESTANHDEVISLSNQLAQVEKEISEGNFESLVSLQKSNYMNLGELQPSFQQFQQSSIQLQTMLSNGFGNQKREILKRELQNSKYSETKLIEQKQIYQRDYQIAEREFATQQRLARQGVISASDLSKEESKLLSKQLAIKQIESQIINNQAEQSAKSKELLELDKSLFEQKNYSFEGLKTLISAVNQWKSNHILIAPASGNVFFQSNIQENQVVVPNQEIFYIGNGKNNLPLGQIQIAQDNLGKVKKGQKVIIKFNSYPSEEFGTVEGVVSFISQIPEKDNTYLIKVALPNGLKTNFKKQLSFRNGMLANADIITEDKSLAAKILHQFRRAFQR